MRPILLVTTLLITVLALAQKPTVIVPTGHNAWITDMSVAANGSYFATASYDNTIKVWDTRMGKELLTLYGHSNVVSAVAFSSDGKTIASGDFDGNVFIWSLATRKIISSYKHRFVVNDIDFSPGDSLVASTGTDRLLLIYSVQSKSITDSGFLNHHGLKLKFSPDGKTVAVLDNNVDGENRMLLFYDRNVKDFDPKRNYYYRHGDIVDFALSPDGRFTYNLVSTDSGQIRIHEIGGFDTLRFNGHKSPPQLISASDSSHIIYTLAVQQTAVNFPYNYLHELKTWDLRKKKCVDSISFYSYPSHKVLLNHLPEEKTLLTYTGHIRSIGSDRLALRDSFASRTKLLTSAYPLNNGNWITVNERGIASVFNLSEPNVVVKTLRPSPINLTATAYLSNDSLNLYSLTGNDQVIRKTEIATGLTSTLWKLESPARNFKISKNERYLAYYYNNKSSSGFRRLNIVDLTNKKIILDTLLRQLNNPVLESYDFTPDEKHFAFTNWFNDTAYVIDLEKNHWSHIKHPNDYPKGYLPVMLQLLAINDSLIATSYYKNSEIIIWNIRTGKEHARHLLDELMLIDFDIDQARRSIFLYGPNGRVQIRSIPSFNLITEINTFNTSVSLAGYTQKPNEIFTYSLDNVMRFWDAVSGKHLYSYVAIDSSDFVILRPDGYYRSTQPASKLLYYGTSDLKMITFDQLDVKYNRPDKVLETIGIQDTTLITSFRNAYLKRIRRLGVDTAAFRDEFAVPELTIINRDQLSSMQNKSQLSLRIRATDGSYSLGRLNVWLNEVPLFGVAGIRIRDGVSKFDTIITVTLSEGMNRVEASVSNVNGAESYRSPFQITYKPVKAQNEKLYFIGIGINKFAEPGHELSWSVKDIRDLAAALKKKHGSNISIDTLFDEKVTVENVTALKRKLRSSTVNDKVIVAYSGHGLLSKDFDYYLSTYHVSFEDPEQHGLPYEALENLLDSIPARKKLMLIDACHSGEVDKEEMEKYVMVEKTLEDSGTKSGRKPIPQDGVLGMKNSFELMQELFVNVGRSTGATVISAAAGTQFAQEKGSLQNGVFTYSILEYMKTHSSVTVSQLRQYVNKRVTELTQGMQVPTTRSETRAVDWKVW